MKTKADRADWLKKNNPDLECRDCEMFATWKCCVAHGICVLYNEEVTPDYGCTQYENLDCVFGPAGQRRENEDGTFQLLDRP